MLSIIYKNYQKEKTLASAQLVTKRQIMLINVNKLTNFMLNKMDENVNKAYINQHRLNNECKELNLQLRTYHTQVKQWTKLVDNFQQALKCLGDVECCSLKVEQDIMLIDSCLQSVSTRT